MNFYRTLMMPLFFFISGVTFKYDNDFKAFITKKIKRLIIPYFCLGAIIILFYLILYTIQHQPIETYYDMFSSFLLQRHFWTIWFLPALFFAEIFYWLITKICGTSIVLATLLSIILMSLTFYYYNVGGNTLPYNVDTACIAQFFIHLGFLTRYIKLKKNLYTLISAVVLLMSNLFFAKICIDFSGQSLDMSIGMYGNELCTILAAISGIGCIILMSQYINWNWVTWLGKNTMIIFALHSRIIIVICALIYEALLMYHKQTVFTDLIFTIASMIIIMIILVPLTMLIKRSKYHYLFGV